MRERGEEERERERKRGRLLLFISFSSNPHPQSPFERALHAINFTSDQLLSHLLDQHMLSIDACDHDGNTPLHYAVAMKNNKAIEILHER